MINSEYPPVGGGASNASSNLAKRWVKAGKQVTVLTAQFDSLPNEETVSGVRIIRIRAIRKRIDRSTPFEQLSFMLHSLFEALKLAKVWNPDITVAFFGVPSGPAAMLLWWIYKIPYIVSLRGGDVPGFRSYDFSFYHKVSSLLIHKIWRNAAAIVANSRGLKKLAQSFDTAVNIKVITNGVDTQKYFVPSRSWDPPVLLTVGRLVNQKGIHVLINGLSEVVDLPWRLTIVGDGKEKSRLEALSADLHLSDRIHFTGWIHREELLSKYKEANLYIHTSFDEGMSNAVLEAMASGLPVLATDISGNLDVIVNEQTGILIEPGDPNAVGQVLRKLIPDTGQRIKFGALGRERVKYAYTWERIAKEYLELIDWIL